MRELSLHILDIAKNSVKAKARLVEIAVRADSAADRLSIVIRDDGCGMSPEFLRRVQDPFTTTRTTRKVGMGIPLFKQAAESAGGSFSISSELGKGTEVRAEFQLSHIDRMPLGDLGSTMILLISGSPDIDFRLDFQVDERSFSLDTREVKQTLEGVPVDLPEVQAFLREMLTENIREVSGGKPL